jgi:hypothetical protein
MQAMLGERNLLRKLKRDELGFGDYRIVVNRVYGKAEHNRPICAQLSFVQSGVRLDGEGDAGCYLCLRLHGKEERVQPKMLGTFKREATPGGCGGWLTADNFSGGTAICPHCGLRSPAEYLTSEIFVNGSYMDVAVRIVEIARAVDLNCDVRLINFRQDKLDRRKLLGYSLTTDDVANDSGYCVVVRAKSIIEAACGPEIFIKRILAGGV